MDAPETYRPRVAIRQADGSILVKWGEPQIIERMISTRRAAQLLGLAQRTVETRCDEGRFKTACKPGGTPRSSWRIALREVQEHQSKSVASAARPARDPGASRSRSKS